MNSTEYLLIKNTLNLQLSIAIQKFTLLSVDETLAKKELFGSDIYDKNVAVFEIKWHKEELSKLEKMYEEGVSYKKAIKELKWLLPTKGKNT